MNQFWKWAVPESLIKDLGSMPQSNKQTKEGRINVALVLRWKQKCCLRRNQKLEERVGLNIVKSYFKDLIYFFILNRALCASANSCLGM